MGVGLAVGANALISNMYSGESGLGSFLQDGKGEFNSAYKAKARDADDEEPVPLQWLGTVLIRGGGPLRAQPLTSDIRSRSLHSER